MNAKFTDRVIQATLILAFFLLLGFWNNHQLETGTAIFCGAAWGCINLLLIKHLLQKFLFTDKKIGWKSYFLLGVKFPMLYFIGYSMLSFEHFSPYSLVSGFILLLATTLGIGILTSLNKNHWSCQKTPADNCHGK